MAYLADKIINHVFGNGVYTPPTELYLALFTQYGEVSGGNYARVDVTGYWQLAIDGATTNMVQVNIPKPTIGWGLITKAALYDAQTGGNLLLAGDLKNPFSAVVNTDIIFAQGSLNFSIIQK